MLCVSFCQNSTCAYNQMSVFSSPFLIKLHVIAELKGFKDSVCCQSAPESAEKREQEKGMEGSSAVLYDDMMIASLRQVVSYQSSD